MKQLWLFLILLGLTLTPVKALDNMALEQQANLVMVLTSGSTLRLEPAATQWLLLQQQLTAVTLREGKLCLFQSNSQGEWIELCQLKPAEQIVTAFLMKDLDGDQTAEIIVGTADPGFIYIYKFENGLWQPRNYGKYVWSDVTAITAGLFDGPAGLAILVQNQEGFLYLLRPGLDSLDLVWCSPNPWRPIERFLTLDIDRDSAVEMVAVYKDSGLALLKVSRNSLVSVWENFPWGKLLAVAVTDWDQDHQPELTFSTSQKILYQLSWNSSSQQLEEKLEHFDYTIEHLATLENQSPGQLLAIDTNGRTRWLRFDPTSQRWRQEWLVATGRIARIINSSDLKTLLLWRSDQRLVTLTVYPVSQIKLRGWERLYPLASGVFFRENRLYLAPTALTVIPELKFTYTVTGSLCKINYQQTTVEIDLTDLSSLKLNGAPPPDPEPPIFIDNQLCFSLESYRKLFGFSLLFNLTEQTISLSLSPPVAPAETKPTDSIWTEGEQP